MSQSPYVPERGDLVWLTFNPQAARDQTGRRPALVLSSAGYNAKVGLGVFCPVTTQAKGYPLEVALPAGLDITGVVLSDHVRNLDWRARRAEFACAAPVDVLEEVLEKLHALLG